MNLHSLSISVELSDIYKEHLHLCIASFLGARGVGPGME